MNRWISIVLSLGLGLGGLALLLRLAADDPDQMISTSPGYIAALAGLSAAIIVAILLLLRELLRRVWLSGVEQVRLEALAEHHRFLRRLDHELKNPLTALSAGIGSLDLIAKDEHQKGIIRTLAEDIQRLSRLVTDLRKIAEIDTTALDILPIEIAAFCAQVNDLMREHPLFAERRCHVDCSGVRGGDQVVIGDPDLLLLAMHNLLDNGFKYSRPGDAISVRFAHKDLDCIIEIEDTGIGIEAADLAHIWEDLYRGSNASAIPGNGIGLSLVRAIIDRHFGSLTAESLPGRGTTIIIRLPLK